MPQSTLISIGTTDVNSSQTDVAVGVTVTVGLFSNAAISNTSFATVLVKTPSNNIALGNITPNAPIMQLTGPVSFIVNRPVQTGAVGVFLNT